MLSRREFMSAVVLPVGLTACSSSTKMPAAVGSTSTQRSGPTTPPTTSAAGASSSAMSRAQVVAKFSGERPTAWGLQTRGTLTTGTRSAVSRGLVALTFDACGGHGGSGYDAALIDLLRRLRVPATLMLNARWVTENKSIATELGSDPLFEIQSHGNRHVPLSVTGRSAYGIQGTRSVGEVYDEVTSGTPVVQKIARHNTVRVMRPGTAYCDDVAARIAQVVEQPVLSYSVNADWGATATASQIVQNLVPVKGGDIVISHMNHPEHATAAGYREALPKLLGRGVKFSHVSTVVGL